MRWLRAWVVPAAAVLALAGCASTPQASPDRDAEAKQFAAPPGAATIYVYRNEFSGPFADDSVLYLDHRLIGATLDGTYFRIVVRPGTHWLRGYAYDQGQLPIVAGAGEIRFVSLAVVAGMSHFAETSPEVAKREIARCCVLLENWAPGQRPLLR